MNNIRETFRNQAHGVNRRVRQLIEDARTPYETGYISDMIRDWDTANDEQAMEIDDEEAGI